MSDLPAEAVQAAARTLKNEILAAESDEALARLILQAAASLIAAEIAQRIADRRCDFRACEACLCRAEAARTARETYPRGNGNG